jgi:MerR family transcriptional regulator, redox-sensitive transcriptional activator SoxR
MEELTIGEVAARAGIRPSAIRYYESVNILPAPRRVSGQRRYDASISRRLAFIQIAQEASFTVAEMQVLFNGEEHDPTFAPLSERWQMLVRQKLLEVEALIQRANGMKQLLETGLGCRCPDLDDCINCLLINCSGLRRQPRKQAT